MEDKALTYETAIRRLETIVQSIEDNTLELDALTTQLSEAQELIKFCNERLQKVETDVNKLLADGKK